MVSKVIKKILIDQGVTITELSKQIGYTRGHVSSVINGRIDSIRVKKILALSLNKSFKEL
ncbi:MAG: helix-turn-helix domain-containing protein, partial [candidate division Zixibacteria bacterium]|nr:helix-turn-helix domain-containing protein [candidate division Zixibacteria bacterium]